MPGARHPLIVIMGVSGAGKSTVAVALSALTGWPMIEGDDHHPPANRAKMARGQPLTNADRAPWVDALAAAANAIADGPVILACSALNGFVRDRLQNGASRTCKWVMLDVSFEELGHRLVARSGHFMPASLLASQLHALDPPEDGIRIDAMQRPNAICAAILKAVG